jgi:hypothetical protein
VDFVRAIGGLRSSTENNLPATRSAPQYVGMNRFATEIVIGEPRMRPAPQGEFCEGQEVRP